MEYDGKISIALGASVTSKTWKNQTWSWGKMVERLMKPHHTTESYKEYVGFNKTEQTRVKDVGGYVAGYLRNGRRKPQNVVHRQVVTLDIDFAHLDFWSDFVLEFENAAVLHATHKHSDASPRYRLIMPLSREASSDEYVAISRAIAGVLGIDLFDNTTFQPERLMFWPSSPRDVEYYVEHQDGKWIDVDEVLDSYIDWKDTSLWPTSDTKFQEIKSQAEKQADPEEKSGLVGIFCRAYSIEEAIEVFLSDEYVKVSEDRYTYTKGSAAAGLIVYSGKFAFSHHGTDPIGGKLCNSFDLVRIHKFGDLDPDNLNRGDKPKSFKEMEVFASKDPVVKKAIASEKITGAKYDFAEAMEEVNTDDIDWMEELEVDGKGKYLSTANNLNLIFANDARLKGIFKHNSFNNKKYVFRNLPWRRVEKPEPVKNVDFSGVRNYIESIYGVVGNLKIEDALALEFERRTFNPVKEYLSKLKWDGVSRINTFLSEYFGTPDTIYYAEAFRKTLVGGVGRILKPGIKFDLVLTLVGDQGTGKSTLVRKLGKEWSSDTFMTVNGKEALEQIQGAWIMEIAELSAFRKAELESVKHFLSKQEDMFRPAYGRSVETYPRQNIFIATTNNKDFLKDPTGNRRFLPIDIDRSIAVKDIFSELTSDEVDQLWAEACHLFKNGEPLYMSGEAEEEARSQQKQHSEVDFRRGMIEDYLNMKLVDSWYDKDLDDRRTYINMKDDEFTPPGKEERQFVCVAEIWSECLKQDPNEMDRYKTRDINDIMRSLDGWEQCNSTKNFSIYGKQKYYKRS